MYKGIAHLYTKVIKMKRKIELKRCEFCEKPLRTFNHSGICANCQNGNIWKTRFRELEKDFEKYKVLCSKIFKDMYEKLKKYEPDLVWADEIERE